MLINFDKKVILIVRGDKIMSLIAGDYRKRIIDCKIEELLRSFGAVCIEGPKWCGKTWASLN